MANLTSTLTLKAVDDISGPMKKAAEQLKSFALSAKDLDKAVKLDALRQSQVSFREAANTYKATQQSVRALAQEYAAADSPTKRMTDAMQRARQEASRAGQAFEQQSAAFRQARVSMESLGVPISKIANEEQRLRSVTQSATAAMEQQAARAQTIGSRLRTGIGGAMGTMAMFAGPGILRATVKGVEAGAALESEKVKLRGAGIPAQDIAAANAESSRLAAQFPNLTRKEILERYKEARSVLLHPHEAMSELPIIAQTNAVMNSLESQGKIEKGSSKGLGFALKAGEVMGLAQDPKRLRSYLDAFVKAKQVMGDLITPEQIYDFATNVKSSGATLSDRFIHTTAMSLTGELRGMRAGTGIDQFVKQITGGFQGSQHSAAKEFLNLGLLGRGDFETTKGGQILGLKSGKHVAGWKLAQSDPDKWVAEYLLPAMKQKGVTDMQEQLALVKKMFTSSRAADIVSKLITQKASFQNHAKLMHDAMGLDAAKILRDDPTVQLEALTTAFSTFGATLTDPIMVNAAHAMSWVSRSVSGWSDSLEKFAKAHPDAAKVIGGGAIATGGAVGGALTIGLVRGLMGGFGLKKSAGALSGSAVALMRAAKALGGGSVLNDLPGGKGKPPASILKEAEKPGFWSKAKKWGPAAIGAAITSPITGLAVAGATVGLGAEALNDYQGITRDSTRARQRKQQSKYNSWGMYDPSADITALSTAKIRQTGILQPNDATAVAPIISTEKIRPRIDDDADVFRLGLSGGRKSIVPNLPAQAQPSSMIAPPTIDASESAAASAGQQFGAAFRSGVVDEVHKAVADVEKAVSAMLGMLTFSASPNITPSAPAGATASGGASGSWTNGLHADYGITP